MQPELRSTLTRLGIDGNADVDILLEDQFFADAVERSVELRKLLERADDGLQHKYRNGELAPFFRSLVRMTFSQSEKVGDVRFLHLSNMRNDRPRAAEIAHRGFTNRG